MKITIEHQGMKIAVEDETAVDITEALDLVEELLVKAGFMSPRVESGFLFKAKEIEARREGRHGGGI